jgi:arthrofactin-type cyclic lipopeptide synthetase C
MNKHSENDMRDGLLYVIEQALQTDLARHSLSELKSASGIMTFEELVSEARKRDLLPDGFVLSPAQKIKQYLVRANNYLLANIHYCPQPIPIRIDLFVADENASDVPFLGWNLIQPEALIRKRSIKGSHLSIMRDENIVTLGSTITDVLIETDQAKQTGTGQVYAPAVFLQRGLSGESPLICIPGAGASVTSFIPLVGSMQDSWSICGLQSRGLDNDLPPHSDLCALAEVYINAIDDVYPECAPHLLGHSFGGWIAFEIALRRQKEGRPVASLNLIDTNVPDVPHSASREYTREDVLLEWIDSVELMLDRPLGIDPHLLMSLSDADQRATLHRQMVKFGVFPSRSQPDLLTGPLRVFARFLRTRYIPSGVYDGPMRYVLVNDKRLNPAQNLRKHREVIEGWSMWVPDIRYMLAPGNHITVLTPPHVGAIAWMLETSPHLTLIPGRKDDWSEFLGAAAVSGG